MVIYYTCVRVYIALAPSMCVIVIFWRTNADDRALLDPSVFRLYEQLGIIIIIINKTGWVINPTLLAFSFFLSPLYNQRRGCSGLWYCGRPIFLNGHIYWYPIYVCIYNPPNKDYFDTIQMSIAAAMHSHWEEEGGHPTLCTVVVFPI